MKRIVIVGSGLAGHCAAIEALEEGYEVVMLEKQPSFGGNSCKASSGMNAVNSHTQLAASISDSVELFCKDTFKAGHGMNDPLLVKKLAENSKEALQFIEKILKLDGYEFDRVVRCGGHSVARTHRCSLPEGSVPSPFGWIVLRNLHSYAKKFPKFNIIFDATVTQLLEDFESTRIVGVKFGEKEIFGDRVVLAAGGFSANSKMVAEYCSETHSGVKYTSNGKFTQGDGMRLGKSVGGVLADMDQLQIHPTGFIDMENPESQHKFLCPEMFRGLGGILINHEGVRFTNELATRSEVTRAIFENCENKEAFLIVSESMVEKFGQDLFRFYFDIKGFFKRFSELNKAAHYIGVEELVLAETFEKHAEGVCSRKDMFDSPLPGGSFDLSGNIYIAKICPIVHYTMGGLKINDKAQVITDSGKCIAGLYACGENTCGVHGGGRLGGNSLLDCVVFGRLAGSF